MKKEDKVEQVEKLTEGLKESQAVLFADYSGLSVVEMTALRRKLSQLGAELRVVKNTLIKLAAEKAKLPLKDLPVGKAGLSGPTAVLFSREADPIESFKAVVAAFKEKGEVKFGVFEGGLLDAPKVLELARLPTRAVLEARLVGALSSPIVKFVLTLKESQRSLVAVLGQVAKARGGGQQ